MASNGVAALNELLQEMQALIGILPVAMVPLPPRATWTETEPSAEETPAEADAPIEAGFDNLPV